ncbi:MAG: lamin tail domain-containing protein [Chloroflexi bacterium]|nr:lamin tail domain-containing protein [Chloroflexota bacterium]
MRYSPIVGALLFFLVCLFVLTGQLAHAQSAQPPVVISQIYGGGGNSGADYTHDFIELFNRGASPVSLAGWSVQYASATGTTWQKTELTGTIQPGRYYLIQQAQGSRGTTPLPAPDAIGAIPMSASSGKVALLNTSELLARGTTCPGGATLVDLLGFGSADCFAGSAVVPGLDNRTAALRVTDGCANTGNNGDDFLVGEPVPRNSANSPTACVSGALVQSTDVITQSRATLTVTAPSIRPNTFPTFTRQVITGSTQSPLPTPGIPTSGTLPVASPIVSDSIRVLISQIYGGGGNAGALYTHDFVELYNAGSAAVRLDDWSVQYASATGKMWLVTVLSGTLQAGGSYLIQQAQGTGGSVALPAADALGETAMSASSGKVALVRNADPLTGACPSAEMIVDFVGYGSADCFEGSGPGAKTSNSRALQRVGEGSQDTGDNRADFVTAPPTPRRPDSGNRAVTPKD